MPSLPVLTYNSVPLQLSQIVQMDERAVYEDSGSRYLFTHVRLVVRCIVHRLATQPINPVTGLPVAPPQRPGVAWPNLRELLLEPKQPLTIRSGDDVILDSPQFVRNAAGALVRLSHDANNGPHPIGWLPETIIGEGSIVGVFSIETWIVEGAGVTPPSILSHQWSMSEHISEEFLSRRTVSGRVVFRPDFLHRRGPTVAGRPAGLRPDDFRTSRFFHPLPDRYQRVSIEVTALPDGTGCTYSCTDVERPMGIPRLGIRKIVGHVQQGYDWLHPFNPSFYRTWRVTAHGYPRCGSIYMMRVLATIYATASTAAGITLVDGWSDFLFGAAGPGTFATRRPFRSLSVTLDYDTEGGPKASFTFKQTLGKVIAGVIDIFAAHSFLDEQVWPENFGDAGGPRYIFNRAGYANGTRGFTLTSVVAQALTPISSPPALPTEPGMALNVVT